MGFYLFGEHGALLAGDVRDTDVGFALLVEFILIVHLLSLVDSLLEF